MTANLQLVREHSRYSELRRQLIEADPEIDDTTLLDTPEGATNLSEAIGEVSPRGEPRWEAGSLSRLPQPYARPLALGTNELDAGLFEGLTKFSNGLRAAGRNVVKALQAVECLARNSCLLGRFLAAPS